jgi:hypothetical protein
MNSHNLRSILLGMLALLAMASSVAAGPAEPSQASTAEVSSNITYQGQLTDASGNPLSGNYGMKFELYDAATGGTKLWEQVINGVAVQEGMFAVQLQVNPSDFDGRALWLAITVSGTLLSPRQELTPAPYALSLRPGARIYGDVPEPAVDVHNTTGVAIQGHSSESYGVVGETLDDTAYVAAGVHGHSSYPWTAGVMGTSEWGWGVYSQILNPDNMHSAAVGYTEGKGNGVSGVARHGIGVVGTTEGDAEWQAAGVAGYSTYDRTFGVLGSSEWGVGVEGSISTAGNANPAVVGYNVGGGPGMEGYSQLNDGVRGSTDSAGFAAGRFENNGAKYGPDVLLGGEVGTIFSDPGLADSGIELYSQHHVSIDLDDDNDHPDDDPNRWARAEFVIYNGANDAVFSVDETGYTAVAGDLEVGGNIQFMDGVVATTDAADAAAGRFENSNTSGAGTAVYAAGGSSWSPDVMLGGMDGNIYSDWGVAGSNIQLISNGSVTVTVDGDAAGSGRFAVSDWPDIELFSVQADGATVTGDLEVGGMLKTNGQACTPFYVFQYKRERYIPVPDFCIDAMCWINILSDGVFGAYGPGFFPPILYMQDGLTGEWYTGPNMALGGVQLGGTGVQGGVWEVMFEATSASGAVLRLWDDWGDENYADSWVFEFDPKQFVDVEYAWVTVCPMGRPDGKLLNW